MRLGEILIQHGVIDEAQLKSALDAQLIYGAHLGTCLIELGYVDEEVLGETLARIFDVQYARRELLDAVPPSVIEKLPQRTVEKHHAVPFDLKDKTLHIAMTDPRDLNALDALRFASNHRIEPWVSPEVRIFQAMERYYGIPRRLRYISLCRRLDEARPKAATTMTAAVGEARARTRPAKPAASPDPPARPAPVRSSTRLAAPKTAAAATPSAAGDPEPSGLVPIVRAQPPAEETGAERVKRRRAAATSRGAAESGGAMAARDALADLSEELWAAGDERRLAETVMRFASPGLARCILFRVRAGAVSVWEARGLTIGAGDLLRVRLDVSSEPIFRLLFGEPFYRGPLPSSGACRGFCSALKMEEPAELLLVPGYVNDSLATFFYGDVLPGGSIPRPTDEYRRLTQKLALALNAIALAREIRSV